MCGDESARITIKQGNGVPTIPASSDHRNGDWIATDIYEGEQYLDNDTGLIYTRNGTDIVPVSGGESSSSTVWVLDMEDALTIDIRAPYAMQIDSVTEIYNSPTTTINRRGAPYTFGNLIVLGDLITVTVSTASWIRLNITQL